MSMSTPKVIRLSVSEAAKIFGIHERTIRRAIAEHELHYVAVPHPSKKKSQKS